MSQEPDPQRLFQKLLQVRDVLDELDEWVNSPDARERESEGVDVGSLLQGLLARRALTLDNLDTYIAESGP